MSISREEKYFNSYIGRILRSEREKQGFTTSEVSIFMDTQVRAINRMESTGAGLTLLKIIRLCGFLNLDFNQVVDEAIEEITDPE